MGVVQSKDEDTAGDNGVEGDAGVMASSGSGVSGALSSLWSTSSEKDDTCVQWGLVSDVQLTTDCV